VLFRALLPVALPAFGRDAASYHVAPRHHFDSRVKRAVSYYTANAEKACTTLLLADSYSEGQDRFGAGPSI
jgi:hypothetical protein